jgi:hypothetical protein
MSIKGRKKKEEEGREVNEEEFHSIKYAITILK